MSSKTIPESIMMFRKEAQAYQNGTPAFPVRVNAGEKTLKKAKEWVCSTSYYSFRKVSQEKLDSITGVTIPNLPRRGFRIVGAEQRSEGGRAWKVITPDGDLVDMREDVFLPILLDRGLPKGGIIDAEFQWCYNHSQLRLEEVGSKQYREYEPESTLQKNPTKKPLVKESPANKVLSSDLFVGYMYVVGKNESAIYMGRVSFRGKYYFSWAKEHNRAVLILSTTNIAKQFVGNVSLFDNELSRKRIRKIIGANGNIIWNGGFESLPELVWM